jgi:hypothetical protein
LTRKRQALKTLLWSKKEKIDGTIITEYQQLLAALQKRRNTVRQNQEEKRPDYR